MTAEKLSTSPGTSSQLGDHVVEYMIRNEYPQQFENNTEESFQRRTILLDSEIAIENQSMESHTHNKHVKRRKSHVHMNSQTILSLALILSTIGFSTAFINPSRSYRSHLHRRVTHEAIENSISGNKILATKTITNKLDFCISTKMYARRKSTTPERVTPLKSKSNSSTKKNRINESVPFPFGSTQSEAFLSTIAIAAEMDDAVASVYSPSTQSESGMTYRRTRGRPKSVAGAMNKSTMLNNIEAEAAADKLIASGMASPNSKENLIELAQERKRQADRLKYYEEIVETDNLDSSLYEEIKETEANSQSKKVTRSPSSAPPVSIKNDTREQLISKQLIPKTAEPKKRRRGRPRKYPLPERDIESVVPVSSPSLQPQTLKDTDASNTQKDQTTQLNGLKSKKLKQSRTKQVRKRDPTLKPGKLKGDKLNLQQYYNTELLTASEEYSLGMKVQFLMQCEDVYQGISTKLVRTPTLSEWAYACGFKEQDEMSKEGYIESRLESSIRPTSPDDDSDNVNDSDEKITGARFVGNGLENETGVGRGRGRVKKPPATELKDFFDDSLVKFRSMQEDQIDPLFSKSFKMNSNGKTTLIPINRGTPKQFVEMILTSKEAKQRMVECNMRLVVSIARRYHNVGVNIQDLVQEGSLGLYRAAEKFDPSKGFKFSTYASWWIQQAVFRSIAYHSRTIRLPVHVHNLLNRARRVKTTLKQELGRTPTNDEMAEQLDMTPEKFAKILNLTKRTISLEKPKYANNPKDLGHASDATLGDSLDSSSTIKDESSPEEAVDQSLFQDDLKGMLKILGEDERRVICARYGLHDGLTRTVSAVAVQLRQSKSWVRSQECRALRKLRRPWYENRLREHQNSLNDR